MHTDFWSENLKLRDHSEDIDVDGNIILERIFGKLSVRVQTGCMWLRIGSTGGLL
jgi:hypothetical protein